MSIIESKSIILTILFPFLFLVLLIMYLMLNICEDEFNVKKF